MIRNAASLVVAFALGVIALDAFEQDQLHEHPTWILDACAAAPGRPADPCVFPVEVFDGVAVGLTAYEKGTPDICPAPAVNQRMGAACLTPDPDYVAWVALTRADLSKAIYEGGSPLRGPPRPAEPFWVGVPGDGVWPSFALGSVFGVGLPVNATAPQLPGIPTLDPQSWSDWWDLKMAACAAGEAACSPLQGGGAIDQPTFNTMLAASPFAAALHPFTFTVNGVTITGTTGPPQ